MQTSEMETSMEKSLKHFTEDELRDYELLEEAIKLKLESGCSPKEEKELRSGMNALKKRLHKERYGLCCDVPNNRCCYFCLKEKTGLHEHKVRQETYGGAILGGMMVNVRVFSYRVCGDCQKKLWARGIMTLFCASFIGGLCGLMLSMLMRINYPSINYVVKGVCGVCYLAAILSLFNTHGQVRMNILWFFATVLFLMVSFPLVLYLHSISTTLSICALMTLSLPTILLGLYKDINLFSKLHGRAVY